MPFRRWSCTQLSHPSPHLLRSLPSSFAGSLAARLLGNDSSLSGDPRFRLGHYGEATTSVHLGQRACSVFAPEGCGGGLTLPADYGRSNALPRTCTLPRR